MSRREVRRKFYETAKTFGIHRAFGRHAERLPTRCANCNGIIDWVYDKWQHMETGSMWCGADGARKAVPR